MISRKSIRHAKEMNRKRLRTSGKTLDESCLQKKEDDLPYATCVVSLRLVNRALFASCIIVNNKSSILADFHWKSPRNVSLKPKYGKITYNTHLNFFKWAFKECSRKVTDTFWSFFTSFHTYVRDERCFQHKIPL